jgi:hypothetical protein
VDYTMRWIDSRTQACLATVEHDAEVSGEFCHSYLSNIRTYLSM